MLSFVPSSMLFGLILAALAAGVEIGARRYPDMWKRLPRTKEAGAALALIALVWSSIHACNMLEGGLLKYRGLIRLLVPAVTVLSYFHLDYLFARAVGGLLILAGHHLLYTAFVAALPARGVLSLICLALGCLGMLLVACPWHLRDWLRRACESGSARRRGSVVLGMLAAVYLSAAFWA